MISDAVGDFKYKVLTVTDVVVLPSFAIVSN